MKVHLAYGKSGLDIDVPGTRTSVVEPRYEPALPDPQSALHEALTNPISSRPLRDLVGADDTVGIVVSDMTRPMPTSQVLQAVLRELPHVHAKNIRVFIGLGTHRAMTTAEVQAVLGTEAAQRYTVIQPDCNDAAAFTTVGHSRAGRPLRLATSFLNCSARIVTGLMEPHLFAGVSGGPKGLLPGIASLDTVIANHSPELLLHPKATWGVTHGNPLWEEILQAGLLAHVTFLVNVTVNRDKAITAIFAGDLQPAFDRGAEFVRRTAMVQVPRRYDVVVTTNSGYPLDLNLYQAVKGMSAAAQIVKPGGAIIAAAECSDGIPAGGRWEYVLRRAASADEIIRGIESGEYAGADQWELLLYAKILQQATVYLKNERLSDNDVRECLAVPCADISTLVRRLLRRYGPQSVACVLPEGPQTVPYVSES